MAVAHDVATKTYFIAPHFLGGMFKPTTPKKAGATYFCHNDTMPPPTQIANDLIWGEFKLSLLEWPYFEIHCIFFSADFSAVSAVTSSFCAVFFETGSLVGFVVLKLTLEFLQRARKHLL